MTDVMIPLKVVENFIITITFEEEHLDMEEHFVDECGMTEDQFEEIRYYEWFCARVSAWKDGKELGRCHLGACAYKSHQEAISTEMGGYLPQMIDEAVADARGALNESFDNVPKTIV